MERGNTKHGPARDDQLAHETEGMVRGAPPRPRDEEWREPEPFNGADPRPDRPPETAPRPSGREFELRSELARILTRDAFPANSAALADRLAAADGSPDLVDRVSRLPAGQRFGSVHEVLEALGISSPETGSR